jgi:tRNA1Val (adenine37-N6)-methyltransferase
VFADADLTEDGFLGGRLRILQPRDGYRAATDPVLLAASVPAQAGHAVLDLGCGAGVAGFCLALRVPGIMLTGVELQPAYADLARRNGAANDVAIRVIEADLKVLSLPDMFDHILMNPPYFPPGAGTPSADAGRETASREVTPLSDWLEFAGRRLKPGGHLHVIQLAARLPDLLATLPATLGSVCALPIAPRTGRRAGRVILRARKGGRAAFMFAAPFVVHEGVRHMSDGEDLSPGAHAVLRECAAIRY